MVKTIKNSEDLNEILNEEIIVYEDVQGSKILINWDGKDFTFIPKNIKNEPISIVDLATQKYYNKCINFFYQMEDRVKNLMPKNWYFQFEYFPDEQPANIKYDGIPKNNLILTSIYKKNKYSYTVHELLEYANLFNVDSIPIIFKGQLNKKQIEAIQYFLNTSKDDLEYVFGENNFAFFFYKLLNPKYNKSYLMENDFNENLQRLAILFLENEDNVTFEILNPLYERVSKNNTTEFAEIYSIILKNFLDFCQLVDLESIKLKGKTRDIIYINLISSIFNIYIKDTIDELKDFDIIIPKFFDKDKFKINRKLITNKLTKEYIDEDDKIEYIFKVILSAFRKEKKKEIGIFTDRVLQLFNKFVNDINERINKHLNIISDSQLRKTGLVDFDKYYDIKYNIDYDGEGVIYPDFYDDFEVGEDKDKKKGKLDFKK